jgi:hypothetical protein
VHDHTTINKIEISAQHEFLEPIYGHLGSSTSANWVSFDLNVSCSSCWGYSLINTLKYKKKYLCVYWVSFDLNVSCCYCWGYSLINTLKLKKYIYVCIEI